MKGIADDETYLFVCGHELFDLIQNSVLSPIIIDLRNQHREVLKKNNLDGDTCKTALCEYQKKVKPIKTLLSKNYRYKHNTPIFDKINADVSQIWG